MVIRSFVSDTLFYPLPPCPALLLGEPCVGADSILGLIPEFYNLCLDSDQPTTFLITRYLYLDFFNPFSTLLSVIIIMIVRLGLGVFLCLLFGSVL